MTSSSPTTTWLPTNAIPFLGIAVGLMALSLVPSTIGFRTRSPDKATVPWRVCLDLNRCDSAELELLPSIGPQLASRIVARREHAGHFETKEDLRSVPGIGPQTIKGIKPWIQILNAVPTRVASNKANATTRATNVGLANQTTSLTDDRQRKSFTDQGIWPGSSLTRRWPPMQNVSVRPRPAQSADSPAAFDQPAGELSLSTSSDQIMALAEEKVREALKEVIDPELYVNIVDLGLVYVVDVQEEKEDGRHDVNVEMTMTSPMCPAGPQLVAGVKNAAEAMEEVDSCDVKVVMEPAWTPEKMTDEARDHLGIF